MIISLLVRSLGAKHQPQGSSITFKGINRSKHQLQEALTTEGTEDTENEGARTPIHPPTQF
jgi:hypothetical protein